MVKMKYGLTIIFLGLIFSQDIPSFNAKRAMDLLKIQCAFGPRYPGSPGHQQMKKFMEKLLLPLSDSLYIMDEEIVHPYQKNTLHLTNFLARFHIEKSYRIILYGSRARGDDRDGSDIDLAISGESITDGDLIHVREFWEESTIPLNLDLVDLGKIDDKLTSRIKAEGVNLWIQS